jgi:hypothetical protein
MSCRSTARSVEMFFVPSMRTLLYRLPAREFLSLTHLWQFVSFRLSLMMSFPPRFTSTRLSFPISNMPSLSPSNVPSRSASPSTQVPSSRPSVSHQPGANFPRSASSSVIHWRRSFGTQIWSGLVNWLCFAASWWSPRELSRSRLRSTRRAYYRSQEGETDDSRCCSS